MIRRRRIRKNTHVQTGRKKTNSSRRPHGATEAIGERFAAFIPVGRSYDPATGQGWEGTGVTPHVAVPAAQALETALQLARAANVKTE